MSAYGTFIQLNTPLALGTEVILQFRLPGVEQEVSVHGEVVWIRSHEDAVEDLPGKGVKFIDMDSRTKQLLQTYIESR